MRLFSFFWAVKRILFVCLGNICRSPLAEELFRDKVKRAGLLDEFEIDSCGTESYHIGELADPRTREVGKENGINVQHHSRQIVPHDFQKYDILLAMDKLILEEMRQFAPLHQLMDKVFLMRQFDTKAPSTQRVPDPYMGSLKDFRDVYRILDRCTDGLLNYCMQKK